MPDLESVEEASRNGEPGFEVTYRASGVNLRSITGRLTGRLATKYPLKANKIERASWEELDTSGVTDSYRITLFVPIDGIEDNKGVKALRGLWKSL